MDCGRLNRRSVVAIDAALHVAQLGPVQAGRLVLIVVAAGLAALAGFATACGARARVAAEVESVPNPNAAVVSASRSTCLALEPCQRECQRGVPGACVREARVWEHGIDVARDRKRAAAMLSELCADRDLEACSRLGMLYSFLLDVPDAMGKAASLLESTCEAGEPAACDGAAWLYRVGAWGTPRDDAKANARSARAAELLRVKCETGDWVACDRYGSTFELASPSNVHGHANAARGMELHEAACTHGIADACATLGGMFEVGLTSSTDGRPIMERDTGRAFSLFQRACDEGSADGCWSLAQRFAVGGLGVPRDVALSLSLSERACVAWECFACAGLADRYDVGDGVARDADRARKLYERACGLGHMGSCRRLEIDGP